MVQISGPQLFGHMTGGKIYEGSSGTHNIGGHQRDYACCHGSPHDKISGIRMFSTLYIYTSYILQWSTYRWFTSCNMVLLRKTGFRNWCQVVMFLVTRPPIAWSVNKRLQDNWNPEWTFNLHWTHAYWVVTFTSFLSKDLEFIWPCLFSPNFRLMAGSHGSQVLSHLRSIAQSQLLRAWKLGLTTPHRS